ncbi:glycosyltransferase family 4 protein [Helicobacter pullorum]|uniref:glycosyltransferase family 4 protein n=1 Tax=Helicobacter pullorum TaxID=35818 RepID=UPI0008168241|nr:glycosyltransferase family 4 protein [Helicobacter pullorum]OCR15153.1 hypothetical protein BA915_05940 [Helicobacter pullorum]
MLKHYIHCHQGYDLKKGGSVGYISSLSAAFLESNPERLTKKGIECCFLFPNISPQERIPNDILERVLDTNFDYTQEVFFENANVSLVNQRKNWFKEIIPSSEYAKISAKYISSIHIHGAYNFLPIYNTLVRMGVESRVIKILTTHNPYQPTTEDLYLINRGQKQTKENNKMLYYFHNERDKWAFKLADCLFFPSEHSLEGYYNTWEDFSDLIKHKPIYFCPTGTAMEKSFLDKNFLRQSLNIPQEAKVLLYIGRFIDVRGYDILIEAAKQIINQNKNIYFVVVGEAGQSPITSKQWIQIPYTQSPQDYINFADACLCPNRGSLFDLSMIEILSCKKPIICSYVGGYKWLNSKTSGVIYTEVNSVESLINGINKFISLDQKSIDKMGQENFELYEQELTLKRFQENYCQTIDQIYNDFKINSKIYSLSFCDKKSLFPLKNKPKKEFLVNQNISQTAQNINANKIQNIDAKKTNLSPLQRKLRKLINNPTLFFEDYFKKRKNEKK